MCFPTATALTWNPQVKAFYARLVAAGKPKMVALGVAMRKMLMIAVGVLRSGKFFDPIRQCWQGADIGKPESYVEGCVEGVGQSRL
jgi:hypothetical protein